MADFVGRVSQYPVVEDTCKVASDAYQWAKGNPTVGTLAGKVESAAWSLASMLKPVVNSSKCYHKALSTV